MCESPEGVQQVLQLQRLDLPIQTVCTSCDSLRTISDVLEVISISSGEFLVFYINVSWPTRNNENDALLIFAEEEGYSLFVSERPLRASHQVNFISRERNENDGYAEILIDRPSRTGKYYLSVYSHRNMGSICGLTFTYKKLPSKSGAGETKPLFLVTLLSFALLTALFHI